MDQELYQIDECESNILAIKVVPDLNIPEIDSL